MKTEYITDKEFNEMKDIAEKELLYKKHKNVAEIIEALEQKDIPTKYKLGAMFVIACYADVRNNHINFG